MEDGSKRPKIKSLGLQLLKPNPDDDEHLQQPQTDDIDNTQIDTKQFKDCAEKQIIEQIQKLSLDGKLKSTEVLDNNKLKSIIPTNHQNIELKDFKSVQRLGKGNQGNTVHKVVHQPTQQVFALKKISLINDENFKKYLQSEVKALIACESPFIVKYSGAFFEEGQVNILLEYMEYGSLGHLLQKQSKIPDVILGVIVCQILLGMKYLHRDMKIIHRDIKPLNLLINAEGFVKITDFGVCGVTNSVDMLNSWVGTTLYMSPERLRQGQYSFDTDIWSLGMTLLECVLGVHPLNGQDKTFWSLLEQVQQFKLPEFPTETNKQVIDFIQQCLHPETDKRPSVEQLLQHSFVKKYLKLPDNGRGKFVQWLKVVFHQQQQQQQQ